MSTRRMTVGVEVDTKTQRILSCPPIVRRFIGQPVSHLVNWLKRQGGLVIKRLRGDEQGVNP